MKRYVVLYEAADDVATRAPLHYPAHRERFLDFHRRGDLLMIGTFGDPGGDAAMGIFGSREAAEEFVAEDPFVLNGVVKAWRIREWDDALS